MFIFKTIDDNILKYEILNFYLDNRILFTRL